MFDLLKQLCEINGASGDEDRVADFVVANIPPSGTVIRRDNLGNVLVFKKGRQTPPKLVMFTAHMDEVGFIVTSVTNDGYLKFATVGGITPAAVFGRQVAIETAAGRVPGVIAGKSVHLLSRTEKDTQPKVDDLVIDIGAADKKEAESHIRPGDYAYFVGEFVVRDGRITAKAIDNRLGCAVMLALLKDTPEYDCVFAFTVQEEIGCRGASAAAFNLEPDICIVLEATTACDTADVKDADKICELGAGPVLSFMDKGTIYDRKLYKIATECGVKFQTKSKIVGGNDASVIHKAAGGVRTLAVSVPCRYIHTPHNIALVEDISLMQTLAEKLLVKFAVL
jgi:endoglucanase